jgi:Transglutaminase-like superfamily
MPWTRSAVDNWHKFQRLSAPERGWFLQALLLLPLIGVLLHFLGLRRGQTLLARFAPLKRLPFHRPTELRARQQAQGVARVVPAAARHGLYPAKCLPQSLTVWWLLRRQGVASDLRIGVRKEANKLHAHAWVEHAGRILNDHADVSQRFGCFESPIELTEVVSSARFSRVSLTPSLRSG